MKLGIYLSWDNEPTPAANPKLNEFLEFSKHAEALEFDTILVGEPPFEILDQCPPTLQILNILGKETNNIRLGTADRVLAIENPITIAETYAALDVALDHRLVCGVAIGEDEQYFDAAGVPFEQCRDLFEEHFSAIRMDPELDQPRSPDAPHQIAFNGKSYQIPRSRFWLTARDFPTMSSAAKSGCAMLPHILMEHRVAIDQYQSFDRMLETNDQEHNAVERPLLRDIFVAETDEQASAAALDAYYELYQYHANCCEILTAQNQLKPAEECSPEELMSHHVVIGSVETVTAELIAMIEQTRADQILTRVTVPGINRQDMLNSLSLLHQHVKPNLSAYLTA